MKILRGIEKPIDGERVLASLPPLAPYASASAGETLRKRLNFFSGRALTHVALTAEQRGRMYDASRLALGIAPGVITGLEVALEGENLILMPGRALTASGEDVELHHPLRIHPDDVPIDSAAITARLASSNAAGDDVIRSRLAQGERFTLGTLRALERLDLLPHALVLVAQPLSIALDRSGEQDSPCSNAVGEGAYSQLAWEDGLQLLWTPWPADAALPIWSSDGVTMDPRFRNRLAYVVFGAERERVDIDDRIRRLRLQRNAESDASRIAALDAMLTALAERRRDWPWDAIGAPLAVVGFDARFIPAFVDLNTVVRQGGGRANRAPLVASAGEDVLWQAQVAQLLEHLAEVPPHERNAESIARSFEWLPPAGVLPVDAVDIIGHRQFVFPASYDVQAQVVPVDMVDALIAESAAMAPYNLSVRDQVQILVPVPARFYDPDLLQLDERIHPLFDAEISRLEQARLTLLTRRDLFRRRFDALSHAITGRLPAYPQDDVDALPDEVGALDAQAFARVHRSTFSAGRTVVHAFHDAQSYLDLAATDELFVFVRLDTRPAAITLQAFTGETAKPLIFWGDGAPPANAIKAGPLPAENGWVRLSVPVATVGLSTARIDGLAFGVVAGKEQGQVHWGYAGKINNGYESYWVSDALPHGATTEGSGVWEWIEQGDLASGAAAEADADALTLEGHARHVRELDTLIDSYSAYRGGVLKAELGVSSPTKGTDGATASANNPPLAGAGLDELIGRLNARVAAANDHIEFGFLRARTDIFRVRQSVLGVGNAERLLTSPAAAELVTRNDNPVATEKDFAEYFKRAEQTVVSPSGGAPGPATAMTPSTPANVTLKTMALRGASLVSTSAPGEKALATSFASVFTPVLTLNPSAGMLGTTLPAGPAAPTVNETGAAGLGIQTSLAGNVALAEPVIGQLAFNVGPTIKEVIGTSLYGGTFNTVTVGERLTGSAAVIAKNAAASGKSSFVQTGAELLAGKGFVIDDLPVFGYKLKEGVDDAVTARSLLEGKLDDSDAEEPSGTDVSESAYFKRGLDAIDNMVRFLRGVELRVEDYKRLLEDAQAARSRILVSLQRIEQQIASLATQLAEVRHDLGVARALRAEEVERIAALIARRRAILTEHVPYLVFRRPRSTRVLIDVPVRAVEPALIEDPVPRCREETHGVPLELQAMVDTLKDVPVAWFKRLSPLILKFDRIDSLGKLIASATQRAAASSTHKLELIDGAQTRTGQLLTNAFTRQAQRLGIATQQQASAVNLIASDTWKAAVQSAVRVIAPVDLIQSGAADRRITLEAAGELDDIAGVASCLYNAFCAVPPATRLQWAERISQADANVSLRVLTVLPSFGDERLGVDYIAWKQMQAMVDWLFSRVSDEPEAIAAINDLVLVALLLAAHAPVKRIIAARVRKLVKPVVNGRLDLEIDPRVVRIGMQVLIHAPADNQLVARAVVEDLSADGAIARIAQVTQPEVTVHAGMQVQLQAGPMLTMARQDASMVLNGSTASHAVASKRTSASQADTTMANVSSVLQLLR